MNYNEIKPKYTVDVLGTPYSIYVDVKDEEDKALETCDGYCDKTCKRIVVNGLHDDCNLEDFKVYQRYVIRHEIVHAFLYESGIGACTQWDIDGQDHPEHMVEWIAYQFPKMIKAFKECDAL